MKTYLVNFTYAANLQSFVESVTMTEPERQQLQALLKTAEQRGYISDAYIGPEQTTPTPFADFLPRLREALRFA